MLRTLQGKVVAVLVVFVALGLGSVILTYTGLVDQRDHHQLVNEAGLQRMRLQKMITYLLQIEMGDPFAMEGLAQTVAEYEKTQAELMGERGAAWARPPADVVREIRSMEREWDALSGRLLEFIAGEEVYSLTLAQTIEDANRLVDTADHVVRLIADDADDRVDAVVSAQVFMLIAAVGLGLFGLYLTHAWIVRPIGRLRSAAGKIAAGDWEARVETQGRADELDQLGEAFNHMAKVVGETLDREREERRLNAGLLASLPVGVVALTRDLRVSFINRRLRELLGLSDSDEFRGRPLDAVMPFREVERAAHEALTSDHGLSNLVQEVSSEQGSKWFEVVFSRLRPSVSGQDPAQDQPVLLMLVSDVTQRRASEKRMRLLSTVVEQTADMVCITDRNGIIEYVNSAFERTTGYRSDEVVGKTQRILKSGRHSAEYYRHLWQTILQGRVFRSEFINRTKEGDLFYIDQTITPIRDEEGRITHFVATGKDITAERRAQMAHGRLATVLERSTDCVATMDEGGRITYLNQAGKRMLGLDSDLSDEPVSLFDCLPDAVRGFVADEVMPFARRRGVWSGELAMIDRAGREIAVSLVFLYHDEEGAPSYSMVARDISERKHFEAQLEFMATHDPLTGLLNRHGFQQDLRRHLRDAKERDEFGSFFFVDLDNFKDINDRFGHQAGDMVLRGTAQILRENRRKTDVVARVGGDEFAVILPHVDEEQAERIAREMVEALRDNVVEHKGNRIVATASIGVAEYPSHGMSEEELMANADLALYRAKETGKDGYSLYSSERDWQGLLETRFLWEQKIRDAVNHDNFTLFYQPVLDLRSNQIAYNEVLIRMRDEKGLILPSSFLNIAERSGLIRSIDRYVVRRATEFAAVDRASGGRLRLGINLSGRAFDDDVLLSLINRELHDRGLDPSSFIFEITETEAITDLGRAREFIATLKGMGCQFALDDFGVGFSSFESLKQLAVDYLKIDGMFVKDIIRNEIDQRLVRSIVDLAHHTGKKVVAEYVTDARTLDFLHEIGADYAQGYEIGMPAPLEDLIGDFQNATSF